MKIKVTQYGKSIKAGGWDTYGDSFTDRFVGDHGNILNDGLSCALTHSARDALGAKHGDTIIIDFGDGKKETREYDDTAPESDMRVDLFNYDSFVPDLPLFAEVTIA